MVKFATPDPFFHEISRQQTIDSRINRPPSKGVNSKALELTTPPDGPFKQLPDLSAFSDPSKRSERPRFERKKLGSEEQA